MKNNKNICHTKMSSLGMCAYLYNSNHMSDFADYIKTNIMKIQLIG